MDDLTNSVNQGDTSPSLLLANDTISELFQNPVQMDIAATLGLFDDPSSLQGCGLDTTNMIDPSSLLNPISVAGQPIFNVPIQSSSDSGDLLQQAMASVDTKGDEMIAQILPISTASNIMMQDTAASMIEAENSILNPADLLVSVSTASELASRHSSSSSEQANVQPQTLSAYSTGHVPENINQPLENANFKVSDYTSTTKQASEENIQAYSNTVAGSISSSFRDDSKLNTVHENQNSGSSAVSELSEAVQEPSPPKVTTCTPEIKDGATTSTLPAASTDHTESATTTTTTTAVLPNVPTLPTSESTLQPTNTVQPSTSAPTSVAGPSTSSLSTPTQPSAAVTPPAMTRPAPVPVSQPTPVSVSQPTQAPLPSSSSSSSQDTTPKGLNLPLLEFLRANFPSLRLDSPKDIFQVNTLLAHVLQQQQVLQQAQLQVSQAQQAAALRMTSGNQASKLVASSASLLASQPSSVQLTKPVTQQAKPATTTTTPTTFTQGTLAKNRTPVFAQILPQTSSTGTISLSTTTTTTKTAAFPIVVPKQQKRGFTSPILLGKQKVTTDKVVHTTLASIPSLLPNTPSPLHTSMLMTKPMSSRKEPIRLSTRTAAKHTLHSVSQGRTLVKPAENEFTEIDVGKPFQILDLPPHLKDHCYSRYNPEEGKKVAQLKGLSLKINSSIPPARVSYAPQVPDSPTTLYKLLKVTSRKTSSRSNGGSSRTTRRTNSRSRG